MVALGSVQLAKKISALPVSNAVPIIAPAGRRMNGYRLWNLMANSGQAADKTNEIVAKTLCSIEYESWLGVAKNAKP